MIPPQVVQDRLWQAHVDMARVGATPGGGSDRPALSDADAEARALLLRWCGPLGLDAERDRIGNLFLRRSGTEARPAVAFGSHLDTVPAGGRFDGVFGVLAGLEALRALHGVPLPASLELVVWTNEEGARFPPAMMGSRVHAGEMALDAALAVRDADGVSVAEALESSGQAGPLAPAPRGWAYWLEAHIEQGPLLEEVASARRLRTRPVVAAAGHDSVLVAPLCPSAMIFVPSRGGITHNPAEYTGPEQLAAGAQVLLDAVVRLAG